METAQNKRKWTRVAHDGCACPACIRREAILRAQDDLFDDPARPGSAEEVHAPALLTAA